MSVFPRNRVSLRTLLARVAKGCVYFYCVGWMIYGGLHIVAGGSLTVIGTIDNLMPALLLPAFVLLPISILMRSVRMVVLLLPLLIAFGLLYGRQFIPHPREPGKPDLTIMTFNIYQINDDYAGLAQIIRESQADVIVLEEITAYTDRNLTKLVKDQYPFSSLSIGATSRLGIGVYSRYALISDDFSNFSPQSSRMRFQIEVDNHLLTLYGVHLANPLIAAENFDPSARHNAITALMQMLSSETPPLIVAGDFNMSDISQDYQWMTTHWIDSYREAGYGLGFTFPAWSPLPLARLDYIFHSDDLHGIQAQVGTVAAGSDHFPVIAQLKF